MITVRLRFYLLVKKEAQIATGVCRWKKKRKERKEENKRSFYFPVTSCD